MTDTTARLRVGSKHYEIMVNLDAALKVKRGLTEDMAGVLSFAEIFYNTKDGSKASKEDLTKAFLTTDVNEIAKRIIRRGDIEVTQEKRDEERDSRRKQVVDWFIRNAVDARTNRPFTADMIIRSIEQAGINISNKPIEQQIIGITESLKTIIPLKIETKKLIITIPAIYTGKAYGIVSEHKEKEDWLSNGDLKVTINIPIGLQSEFYDKLNAITHGAALSEEAKQ